MKEENRLSKSAINPRLYTGTMPELSDPDFLRRRKAARNEIAELPYGSENPKAIEIAKKYGLKQVPS